MLGQKNYQKDDYSFQFLKNCSQKVLLNMVIYFLKPLNNGFLGSQIFVCAYQTRIYYRKKSQLLNMAVVLMADVLQPAEVLLLILIALYRMPLAYL